MQTFYEIRKYEDNITKIKCKCGHVVRFLRNHSQLCSNCGKLIYPSEKARFKEKLLKEMRVNYE